MDEPNNKENSDEKTNNVKPEIPFKKPILIGKIGRLPRKVQQLSDFSNQESDVEITEVKESALTPEQSVSSPPKPDSAPVQQLTENSIYLPYKEPSWSGVPENLNKDYVFEVLKNGSIIETINLMSRPSWIFGRLTNCNICMQHPTISRYHAVLQYRSIASESEGPGFYIYDLGSTHGTFLNKSRLKPKVYVRMQVGHMLKLGCSTRSYILNGPDSDTEDESELSVTELKQKRAEDIRRREEEAKEAALKTEKELEEKRKKEEERGVDWGLGEDADEESDLTENPYAQTTNEELYLDDPKKALRGFYEREGVDLVYDCNEQGLGQFVCKVELPLDDELGRPMIVEVLHKGKKKEAVVQCALKACRILDTYGVLRQATHESRKRKAKNWEENDFYDSDDDTFLDRTGTIEQKREMRMKAKLPQKAETYESLVEKEKKISESITNIEKQLGEAQAKLNESDSNSEEDPLDNYMKELKQPKLDKQTVTKLKLDYNKLKQEHANVVRLANIAKPTDMPALMPHQLSAPSTSKTSNKALPMYGKRMKIKVQLPAKSTTEVNISISEADEYDDSDEDKSDITNDMSTETSTNGTVEHSGRVSRATQVERQSSSSSDDDIEAFNSGDITSIKSLHSTMTFKRFEKILQKGLPPFADKHQDKLEKILNNLKKLASNEDRMHTDWKILAAKKRKVMKLISDLRICEPNEKLERKVALELNRILVELNTMTEQKYKVIGKVKKMGNEIKSISDAITKDFKKYEREYTERLGLNMFDSEPGTSSTSGTSSAASGTSSAASAVDTDEVGLDNQEETDDSEERVDERKKKKNQRRIQQRQERAEIERQRGYQEDATREDYNMWVPPTDQSGDGRTNLNDKYGY